VARKREKVTKYFKGIGRDETPVAAANLIFQSNLTGIQSAAWLVSESTGHFTGKDKHQKER
jgi:hypothetical protein